MNYNELVDKARVEKVMGALKENGIDAHYVETGEDARMKVLEMVPPGAKVMTMTSVTVESIGLAKELNESGKYEPLRDALMDPNKSPLEKNVAVSGAEWVTGSVHGVTEEGFLVIASNTGSQLPAYAYNAPHVVWVVSTKKIVRDLGEAMDRIEDHIVPQESVRARKAYGLPDTWHTYPSKTLIIRREVNPGRLHLIFVNEDLGF
jgi:L-lactate utilization protein LutC